MGGGLLPARRAAASQEGYWLMAGWDSCGCASRFCESWPLGRCRSVRLQSNHPACQQPACRPGPPTGQPACGPANLPINLPAIAHDDQNKQTAFRRPLADLCFECAHVGICRLTSTHPRDAHLSPVLQATCPAVGRFVRLPGKALSASAVLLCLEPDACRAWPRWPCCPSPPPRLAGH
eukprot:351073-Chlamydomonas_euryale.AAC.5